MADLLSDRVSLNLPQGNLGCTGQGKYGKPFISPPMFTESDLQSETLLPCSSHKTAILGLSEFLNSSVSRKGFCREIPTLPSLIVRGAVITRGGGIFSIFVVRGLGIVARGWKI